MAELLSFRKYAKRRGVSTEAVSKAVRTGRISVITDESGKRLIDPEKADAEWEKNTYAGARRDHAKAEEKAKPEPAADDEPKVHGPSYAQSRAIREAYQARIARLEYEERTGKLVNADKVRLAAFNTARIVRDSILNIPDKIASELAAEGDPHKVHVLLTEALIEALEELTRGRSS